MMCDVAQLSPKEVAPYLLSLDHPHPHVTHSARLSENMGMLNTADSDHVSKAKSRASQGFGRIFALLRTANNDLIHPQGAIACFVRVCRRRGSQKHKQQWQVLSLYMSLNRRQTNDCACTMN